jgi:hypothetical protein
VSSATLENHVEEMAFTLKSVAEHSSLAEERLGGEAAP